MQAIFRKVLPAALFVMLILPHYLSAQDNSTRYIYRMTGRATNDSVMLRWAPANYDSWQRGNRCGYQVVRYTLYRNNKMLASKEKKLLTPQPLKPWSLNIWEPLADNDDYAGVAAQALYGEDFAPEPENKSTVVNIFNQGKEQENRYAFALFAADMSVNTARGLALYFADHQVKKGEKYLYVVYPACSDALASDTAFVYTGPDEFVPLIKPVFTQAISGSGTVTLQWKSPEGRWGYTAFEIERSADQGKTFAKVNRAPMVNTTPAREIPDYNYFIDSLPDNQRTYYYRLRGINPFGEKGPYTDTISVKGKAQISITPRIVSHFAGAKGTELVWDIDTVAEKQVTAFKVMRSANNKTGWTAVSEKLPVATRKFTDAKPLPTAYYKVSAWGSGGDISSSFPVLVQQIDSIPPDAPMGVTGLADTTGKVVVRWKSNREADIYGYRVYRANGRNEEFSQLTVQPVRDTFFVDNISLRTLTPHVYYRIMAIDKRQNYSMFSDMFELKRPDIVPPVAPVITDIYSSFKGITITFMHSTSTDVVAEYLMRRQAGTEKWDTCATITRLDSVCTDTLAQASMRYEYTLRAKDDAGLISKTAQVVTGVKLASPPAKPQLKAYVRRTQSLVELQWQPLPDGKFQVYRAEDEGRPYLYTALDGKSTGFKDKNVKPGHAYKYQLKYVGENGVSMGDKVEVSY